MSKKFFMRVIAAATLLLIIMPKAHTKDIKKNYNRKVLGISLATCSVLSCFATIHSIKAYIFFAESKNMASDFHLNHANTPEFNPLEKMIFNPKNHGYLMYCAVTLGIASLTLGTACAIAAYKMLKEKQLRPERKQKHV